MYLNIKEKDLEKTYKLTSGSIIRYLIKNGVDYSSAEDILHDSFVLLWKNREKLTSQRAIPAYWYKIVRHKMSDHFNKSKRHTSDIMHNNRQSKDLPCDRKIDCKYIKQRIDSALLKLPNEMRTAYVMAKIDGFSIQTISNKLSCNKSLIKVRIFRARQKLCSLLKDINSQ